MDSNCYSSEKSIMKRIIDHSLLLGFYALVIGVTSLERITYGKASAVLVLASVAAMLAGTLSISAIKEEITKRGTR